MIKRFSHIVWLGAGTAKEPAGLLDMAERATLIETREIACLSLQQQYPQERISIKQLLLTVDGASTEFTEYNLAEYSAIQSTSGLKELFPGLKAVNRENLNSTRINDVVHELALQDNNNLLVVDVTDSNLALLTSLQQSGQLSKFNAIRIQTGIKPLYIGAATTLEVTTFLQQQGYLLVQTVDHDPDLPWLSFSVNPLWQTLQNARQNVDALDKELAAIKQQLAAIQQAEHAITEAAQEQLQLISKLEAELDRAKKHSAARLDKISQLEKSNRALDETNTRLTKQRHALKQELLKAEAQIDILRDLFLTQESRS